ncbi:hypothetical protein D0T85_12680 [Bacteroides sp. 519]|nr:hypothetical protein [Bacteroides sp. 519]
MEGSGAVIDRNNTPISNAEVTILCWKDLGLIRDEVNYSKKIYYTDSKGKFSFKFDKGYKLSIGIRAYSYDIEVMEIKSDENIKDFNIVLNNNSKNNTIYYRNRSLIREYKCQEKDCLEIIEEGLDIVEGKNGSDADIWITQGKTISTKPAGGIIPILKEGQKNLITNYLEAPSEGYVQEYKITGKEVGYFIKTNEHTYAKVILSALYEKNFNEGNCLEKGYVTQIIYQPDSTRRLSIPHFIDMEQLLLMIY